MTNSHKSEFTIDVNSKEWILKYDNTAIAYVEDQFNNRSIVDLLGNPGYSIIATCFLAGVQWRKDQAARRLTKAKVLKMFDGLEDMARIGTEITKAVLSVLKIDLEDEEEEENQEEGKESGPPEDLTGTSSSSQPLELG